MRIRDIQLSEVAEGKNWRLRRIDSEQWWEQAIEEWLVEPADVLDAEDLAVYSAIFVSEDGAVEPRLLIKEVSAQGWGGDYCEFANGKWRQLGLVPDPNAPYGFEWVANPSPIDPSFLEA